MASALNAKEPIGVISQTAGLRLKAAMLVWFRFD
jgi:hypothetical protein